MKANKYAPYILLGFGLIVHLISIPALDLDPLYADATQFNNEADNLRHGLGWINTEGPGQSIATYPSQVIFLLICKYIFSDHAISAAVVLQHIFVLITALLIYRIALMITGSRHVALLSEIIIILFPHMIYYSNILVSHVLGMMLSVAGTYLLMRRYHNLPVYIGIGAVWAIATMARFTYQFFVPLFLVVSVGMFIFSRERRDLKRLARPLLLALGFVLVMMPWYVHVYKNQAGPYGYAGSWRICYAFNRAPEARNNDRDDFERELAARSLPADEMDQVYKEKVIRNFKEHPEWFVNNWLTNLSFLLINVSTEVQPHMAIYSGIYYSMLLAFMLVGFLALNRSQIARYMPAFVFLVVLFAVHIPIYGYLPNAFPVWALFVPVSANGIIISVNAAIASRGAAS